MFWIFNLLESRKIDPFERKLLEVNSPPMREDYPEGQLSAKNLVKWNGNGFYTIEKPNASFEFHFLYQSITFTKYKVLSRGGSRQCSPHGHVLEGSKDGINYDTIHVFPYDLCNATNCLKKIEKTFELKTTHHYRFIRMTQHMGECGGVFQNFGLTSIDFYGFFGSYKQTSTKIYKLLCPIFLSIFMK